MIPVCDKALLKTIAAVSLAAFAGAVAAAGAVSAQGCGGEDQTTVRTETVFQTVTDARTSATSVRTTRTSDGRDSTVMPTGPTGVIDIHDVDWDAITARSRWSAASRA